MPSNNKFMDRPTPRFQAGFSLIEIMVGLVIGLLATMVITQVFSIFEGQKRSTTGSADAQTNGNIALFSIQRDAQMAGYGLPVFDTVNTPLNCWPSPSMGIVDMFPIRIVDGGAAPGASDRVTVRYGPTDNGGIPVNIVGLAASVAQVNNNLACRVGDIALISLGSVCVMKKVTGPTDIDVPPVPSVPPDKTGVALADALGVSIGASLACIGGWNEFIYAADATKQLIRNGVPIVAGIVNIQAQYGISGTAGSNLVTSWVNADGAYLGTTVVPAATPALASRNRIKAIRVAVVARNGQMEKTAVTDVCSSTTVAVPAPTGLCAWAGEPGSPAPVIDLSDDPDWRKYRYRVFETIIPLRNMIWSKNTLGP